MRAILVTGASGFIGRAVGSALGRAGRRVVGVDLAPAPEPVFPVTLADLCDRAAVEWLVREREVASIVHCGGISGPMLARDKPELVCRANILGTVNVLECARRLGVSRVVFLSSCGIYGDTGPSPVGEQAPFAATDVYGASKASGDMLVRAYAEQHGIDALCLRIAWVYGPGRKTDCVIRTMLIDALASRPTRLAFGAGFHRQFVFIDDVVEAILAALDAETVPQRAYNITGGTRISFDELTEIVREAVPSADIELGSGPDPLDYDQELFDISAARRDLRWWPRYDLRHGIELYAAWLMDRK